MRGWALALCVAAALVGARFGDPAPLAQADPELARLLRAMAILKGVMAVAALGAVLWRLQWPVSAALGAAYLGGVAAMTGATFGIWNLEHIGLASVLFHAGGAAVVVSAFLDRSR